MSEQAHSERMVQGMKKRFLGLILTVFAVMTVVCSVTAFADDFVFTQHKVVLSYEKETNTVYADIFISKGTAIVGYCSFTYDSDVLELMDVNGNPVTAGNVPDFGDRGNIYLTDIVTAHNGIIITDIGKMTSNLVNPEEGYIMFAWFLPASSSNISADEGEVLLANFSFNLKEDITYEEFDKDIFWVADNEVTDKVIEAIDSKKYDVIILNYANCDMVGHTGVFEAAVKAVETVDECVGRVVDAVKNIGGVSVITADHGNADKMLEEDGVSPFTAHTTNEVPFCIVGANVTLRDGGLCDIAPTMLDLMGIDQPGEMTGESLIVE